MRIRRCPQKRAGDPHRGRENHCGCYSICSRRYCCGSRTMHRHSGIRSGCPQFTGQSGWRRGIDTCSFGLLPRIDGRRTADCRRRRRSPIEKGAIPKWVGLKEPLSTRIKPATRKRLATGKGAEEANPCQKREKTQHPIVP